MPCKGFQCISKQMIFELCHDSTGRPLYEKVTRDNCKQSNRQNTKSTISSNLAIAGKLSSKYKSEMENVLLNKVFGRTPEAEA